MAVYEGGTFGPGDTFSDGNIFVGVTFKSVCIIGEGCMFENCNFIEVRGTTRVGAGATVTGGFVEWTKFGDAAMLSGVSIGSGVSYGADSKIDGGVVTQTGGPIAYEGKATQGSTTMDYKWRCNDWACKPPYINIAISGIVNAPVKVTEAGKTYEIPSSG